MSLLSSSELSESVVAILKYFIISLIAGEFNRTPSQLKTLLSMKDIKCFDAAIKISVKNIIAEEEAKKRVN